MNQERMVKRKRAQGECLGIGEPKKDVVNCEKLRGAVSEH